MIQIGAKSALVIFLLLTKTSAYIIWITVYTSTYNYDECRAVYPYKTPENVTSSSTNSRWFIEADGAPSNKSLSYGTLVPVSPVAESRNFQSLSGKNTNQEFYPYDAFYNGSYTMTLEPPASRSNCPKLTSQTLDHQYLRIGPQSRNTHTRSSYDKNPYFLSFGTTVNGTQCPYAANKAFVGFTSSDDGLDYAQPWSLSGPEKKGDSFALAGKLSQVQASNGNYFFYTVNTTGSDSTYSSSCIYQFSQHSLTSGDEVSLTADVNRDKAVMRFQFVDRLTGYTVKGEFNGAAWTAGARLDMTASAIVTDGQILMPKSDEEIEQDAKKLLKTIVISVVAGVAVLIVLLVACCCLCVRRRRKRASAATSGPVKQEGSVPPPYGYPQ